MTEDFLHYIWKYRKFDFLNLRTTAGEEIQLVKAGHHNRDSGPDFHDARIVIDGQLWAGNVELHLSSSDWYRHGHQNDPAYSNVILHVVYEDDRPVKDKNGNFYPTLVLAGKFDEELYWQYERLLSSRHGIPCQGNTQSIEEFTRFNMLQRVMVERLEVKSATLASILDQNNGDWEETFYQWLCRAYGLKINQEPMLLLSRMLPYRICKKHLHDLHQTEALFFGVGGFLRDPGDEYGRTLQEEFKFQRKKYGLPIMDYTLWKYSRLRPTAFPDLRLAQFAALLVNNQKIFSSILDSEDVDFLIRRFRIEPSDYWKIHYRFGKMKKRAGGTPGTGFINGLFVNVIVPFLFIYGKRRDDESYRNRALKLLEHLPAENNRITRIMTDSGFEMSNAFSTQAGIQLYNNYCKPKKCLNCTIGTQLLK